MSILALVQARVWEIRQRVEVKGLVGVEPGRGLLGDRMWWIMDLPVLVRKLGCRIMIWGLLESLNRLFV